MKIADAIVAIEAAVPDPTQGLPEEIFRFVSRINPLINVDLLIQDEAGRTLLTWRHDDWYGPGWHVPGGIIRYKEFAADRVVKTARIELDVAVEFDAEPIAIVQTIVSARERGHFVSLLYRCRLQGPLSEILRAMNDPPANGEWRWFASAPDDLIVEQKPYSKYFRAE